MKYIILDLEATCWQKGNQRNEIIEIGAVCIDEGKKTLGEFSEFVRPVCHPCLSDFCTELTTITQAEIDRVETFPIVVNHFQNWITGFLVFWFLVFWFFGFWFLV